MKIELLIKNLSFLFIEQVIRFKSQSNKIISWIHLNENVKIDLFYFKRADSPRQQVNKRASF